MTKYEHHMFLFVNIPYVLVCNGLDSCVCFAVPAHRNTGHAQDFSEKHVHADFCCVKLDYNFQQKQHFSLNFDVTCESVVIVSFVLTAICTLKKLKL